MGTTAGKEGSENVGANEVAWTENVPLMSCRVKGKDKKSAFLRKTANAHFNSTLMLLNESLGTCLR